MKQEKVEFKNSKGQRLAGIMHIPEEKTDRIIIIVHGFTSNKEKPRFVEASKKFAKEGYAILRFDFSACGESEGDTITIKDEVDELNLAIDFVKNKGYKKIGLFGSSLGGLISLLVYNKEIQTMIFLAPVTAAKEPGFLKEEKYRNQLKEKGFVIFERKDQNNKKYKLPKQYFKERATINQEEVLSKVKCPVLILQGDIDESIPLEVSKKAMQFLSKDSKLEVIKNCGHHDFDKRSDRIIKSSLDWLKEHLQ